MSSPNTPPPSLPASSPDAHRIAKLLARAGVASRREIERMIAEGRVAKDGIVLDTAVTVLPSLDGVTVDGEPVAAPEPARLFLYHKPVGLLVTERDPAGRPTIYDRLPTGLPRVVPVGRLDLATEGLLLLTTDGGLKRQLELPATGVERSYRARVYGPVTQDLLETLIEGIEIEGVRYGSIDANLERRTGTNSWVEMTLKEGKNREVRRVLEYLGLQVSRLIRTRYGPFVLGDLPPGEVGEVRGHDVASFRKNPTRIDLPQPARAGRDRTTVTNEQVLTPVVASGRGGRAPAGAPRRDDRASPSARPARPAPAGAGRADRSSYNAEPGRRSDGPARRPAGGGFAPDRARPAANSADRADTRTGEAPARPPRGGAKPASVGRRAARSSRPDKIAKPARAARARTFRETSEHDSDAPRPTRAPTTGSPRPDRARPGVPPRAGATRPTNDRAPRDDRPRDDRPRHGAPDRASPRAGATRTPDSRPPRDDRPRRDGPDRAPPTGAPRASYGKPTRDDRPRSDYKPTRSGPPGGKPRPDRPRPDRPRADGPDRSPPRSGAPRTPGNRPPRPTRPR